MSFGVDISRDLRGYTRGTVNLIDALRRRLETPRGALFYDPDYGFDLRQYVQAAFDDALRFEGESFIETECYKDERVDSVLVTSELENDILKFRIQGQADDNQDFEFILELPDVNTGVFYGDN
jgi:phage baseplate assembly protein W